MPVFNVNRLYDVFNYCCVPDTFLYFCHLRVSPHFYLYVKE